MLVSAVFFCQSQQGQPCKLFARMEFYKKAYHQACIGTPAIPAMLAQTSKVQAWYTETGFWPT